MPNVLSPRDLVSRPDNMDKTVLHTQYKQGCTASEDGKWLTILDLESRGMLSKFSSASCRRNTLQWVKGFKWLLWT